MKVVVTNVNYFTANTFNQGQNVQTPGASVTFASQPTNETVERVEAFSLSYTNLQGPINFFPGEVYELTFNKQEVASEN